MADLSQPPMEAAIVQHRQLPRWRFKRPERDPTMSCTGSEGIRTARSRRCPAQLTMRWLARWGSAIRSLT